MIYRKEEIPRHSEQDAIAMPGWIHPLDYQPHFRSLTDFAVLYTPSSSMISSLLRLPSCAASPPITWSARSFFFSWSF